MFQNCPRLSGEYNYNQKVYFKGYRIEKEGSQVSIYNGNDLIHRSNHPESSFNLVNWIVEFLKDYESVL